VVEPVEQEHPVGQLGEGVVGGVVGQLLGRLLPLGDVVDGDHEPADGGDVAQVADDALEGAPPPLGVADADLAARRPADRGAGQLGPVRVEALGDRSPAQVVGFEAEQHGDRRAHVLDVPLRVGHHDEVVAVLDQRPVVVLPLAHVGGRGVDELVGVLPGTAEGEDQHAGHHREGAPGGQHGERRALVRGLPGRRDEDGGAQQHEGHHEGGHHRGPHALAAAGPTGAGRGQVRRLSGRGRRRVELDEVLRSHQRARRLSARGRPVGVVRDVGVLRDGHARPL
jgi:hypothetical protein